jgi:ferric-dicitrate binding protein FerR (iron transport regulator)
MQLKIARLCLDCDEVHDAQQCPVCASEAFAYLTRWVPAPERRMRPRPTTSPAADVYRELTSPNLARRGRLLTRSALGVTAIAVAGWIWRWNKDQRKEQRGTATGQSPEPVVNGEGDQTLNE